MKKIKLRSTFCLFSFLQAMQARFDFAGALIPPTEDLPTHLGLHHHGDEPEVSRQHVQGETTSI